MKVKKKIVTHNPKKKFKIKEIHQKEKFKNFKNLKINFFKNVIRPTFREFQELFIAKSRIKKI